VTALTTVPLPVSRARDPEEEGGLPSLPGFYAWWAATLALPDVPLSPHPQVGELGLLYVGIAPGNASSSQTVRSRVIKNHLSGNLGSSTFRFTLAALLRETLQLHPEKRTTKLVLPSTENKQLSKWQEEHLQLTWCAYDTPWLIEHEVIEEMEPPLNLAANSQHLFHARLSEARRALRVAAATSPSDSEGSG